MPQTEQELLHMSHALGLASRGGRHTFPNPLVGAVVLDREGEIVGEGWHVECGAAHAETEAIRDAGDRAFGGTLIVTVEPCCCHGRTPPCTDLIIEAGISRVLIGMTDPNPDVSGAGAGILEEAGLDVVMGVLSDEAELQNRVYVHYLKTGRSMLQLKLAVSLDGRTAAADGSSRWITGPESRCRVHLMRKQASAVLIGAGTARTDSPALTVREVDCPPREQPVRIVAARIGNTSFVSRMLQQDSRLVIALPEGSSEGSCTEICESGADLWLLPSDYGGIDLGQLLERTAAEGMGLILCEGGHTLATALLARGLVDRLSVFTAPILLGREGIPALDRLGIDSIDTCLRLGNVTTETLGLDFLIEGDVVYRPD
jgi:diaminohydroxyphosphoribosylaminopyrimidine deaminase/5-amino-6-(5-phosphoribosylamino)uracil reductase